MVKYNALPRGSFRLLVCDDHDDPNWTLKEFTLSTAPKYIALSYTWGSAAYEQGRDPNAKYTIRLDSEDVEVDQNLYDAIINLAQHVRARFALFWVDALCINQQDDHDKGTQVKLMKTIYEKADHIYAWLGVPYSDHDANLAVGLMRSMRKYLQNGLHVVKKDILTVANELDSAHSAFPSLSNPDAGFAWEGIADMFLLGYWNRTWVR